MDSSPHVTIKSEVDGHKIVITIYASVISIASYSKEGGDTVLSVSGEDTEIKPIAQSLSTTAGKLVLASLKTIKDVERKLQFVHREDH